MASQRRAYEADTRPLIIAENRVVGAEGRSPHSSGTAKPARWRAFQIAFLLASLPGLVNPDDHRAEAVDIIWMPTGGGKTEAYQAVAVFTMLWQRLHQVRAGTGGRQGSTVLMRYTLRLLTAQQLQRTAALDLRPGPHPGRAPCRAWRLAQVHGRRLARSAQHPQRLVWRPHLLA